MRDVSLTAEMVERIRPLLARRGLLFTNAYGKPLRAPTFHKSGWTAAVAAAQEAGLTKSPRPHDLRHTHASWLLQEGVPMFVVSRRLGHANIATTTKLYGHITPQGHREAIAGLERALER